MTDSSIIYVSTKLRAESFTLQYPQAIFMRSDNELNFDPYSWYEPDTLSGSQELSLVSITDAAVETGDENNPTSVVNEVDYDPIVKIAFYLQTWSSLQTDFRLGGESTKTSNDTSEKWTVQPVSINFNENSYPVKSDTTDDDITSQVNQCQGIGYTYSVEVAGKTSLPNWIVYNSSEPSLVIRPSEVNDSEYIGSNTVQITSQTTNMIPATKTIDVLITFTNALPTFTPTLEDIVLKAFNTSEVNIEFSDEENDLILVEFSFKSTGSIPTAINHQILGNNTSSPTFNFSWTPNNDDEGEYEFEILYWDKYHDNAKQNHTFKINVVGNLPPDFVSNLTDQTIEEWKTKTYSLPSAVDPEDDPITITSTKYK
jgi:hypothetical protein